MQGKLVYTLWAVHWQPMLVTGAMCILHNLSSWAGPLLLQQLLTNLQAGTAFCEYVLHPGLSLCSLCSQWCA